jgi:hypothetical protein
MKTLGRHVGKHIDYSLSIAKKSPTDSHKVKLNVGLRSTNQQHNKGVAKGRLKVYL